MFTINRFANTNVRVCKLQYGTVSTITIIGLAIWPDLITMQSLNHTIKICPTVFYQSLEYIPSLLSKYLRKRNIPSDDM